MSSESLEKHFFAYQGYELIAKTVVLVRLPHPEALRPSNSSPMDARIFRITQRDRPVVSSVDESRVH